MSIIQHNQYNSTLHNKVQVDLLNIHYESSRFPKLKIPQLWHYVLCWVGPSMLFPKYLGMKFMPLAVLWVIKSLSLIQEYCVSCQYLPWNCCRLVHWSEVRIKSQTLPIIDRNLDISQKKYGCIFLAICPTSRFLKL